MREPVALVVVFRVRGQEVADPNDEAHQWHNQSLDVVAEWQRKEQQQHWVSVHNTKTQQHIAVNVNAQCSIVGLSSREQRPPVSVFAKRHQA